MDIKLSVILYIAKVFYFENPKMNCRRAFLKQAALVFVLFCF